MTSRRVRAVALFAGLLATGSTVGVEFLAAQIPDKFKNLRVLSKDISRDSLLVVMRGFSFALGVRCQYCHVGGDGVSFEGVEFDSDDDPDKRKARFMLRMVANLNGNVLPLIPERDEPAVTMECKTCHRGLSKPLLLKQELRLVMDEHGADSAVAHYRELRDNSTINGMYDFGEWEMNVFAENLAGEGRDRDAIAVYTLNAEFYPNSASIQFSLGGLYEAEKDIPTAIRYYERTLELRPEFRRAQERLEALRGGG